MTESDYTRRLLYLVKQGRDPAPLVYKCNDRIRRGWPDAQIVGTAAIVFLEAKRAPDTRIGWKRCTPIQQATLLTLAKQRPLCMDVVLVTYDGSINCGLARVWEDGPISMCEDRSLAYIAGVLRELVTA